MSYSKGFKKGYQKGFNDAFAMVLGKVGYSIEFAGVIRKLKEVCDTFIEMPFRLKFLRPDGSRFLDKNGKEQGPKFSCAIGIITPIGLKAPSRVIEYDFRPGFYEK